MIEIVDTEGFLTRNGTTDANAVYALANDEYRLEDRSLSGWAIDVGAHIGTVALTMARLNPDLRVLAVEAVPENSNLLEQNIARQRLGNRVTSIRASAAAPGTLTGVCHYGYRHRDSESDGYVSAHRFVGNTWIHLGDPEFSIDLPAVSLDSLLTTYGIDEVALLKIDCEGCEWAFLDTPAIGRVQTIVGEYHGGYPGEPGYVPNPAQAIDRLLAATHDTEIVKDDPCVGLFEAVRR